MTPSEAATLAAADARVIVASVLMLTALAVGVWALVREVWS